MEFTTKPLNREQCSAFLGFYIFKINPSYRVEIYKWGLWRVKCLKLSDPQIDKIEAWENENLKEKVT